MPSPSGTTLAYTGAWEVYEPRGWVAHEPRVSSEGVAMGGERIPGSFTEQTAQVCLALVERHGGGSSAEVPGGRPGRVLMTCRFIDQAHLQTSPASGSTAIRVALRWRDDRAWSEGWAFQAGKPRLPGRSSTNLPRGSPVLVDYAPTRAWLATNMTEPQRSPRGSSPPPAQTQTSHTS